MAKLQKKPANQFSGLLVVETELKLLRNKQNRASSQEERKTDKRL